MLPPKQLAPKGAAPEQTRLCQKAKPRNPETKTPARNSGHQNMHLAEHPKPPHPKRSPNNSVPMQRKTPRLNLKPNLKMRRKKPPSLHAQNKLDDAASSTTTPPSP